MKTSYSQPAVCLLSGILFVLVSLAPHGSKGLVPVAQGELFVNAEARTTYDSNVYRNRDEVGDVSLTLTPELQFIRDAGVLHLDARAGVAVQRYLDENPLDAEDFYFEAGLIYPVAPGEPQRTRQTLNLFYRERTTVVEDNWGRTTVVEDFGEVTETRNFGGDYGVRYRLTEKLATRGRLLAERWNYRRGRFSDRNTYSASSDLIWLYSPKLDFFTGYRFRRVETRRRLEGIRDVSSRDHQVSVGAEGELLPKVTGAVRVGYQYRDFDDRERGGRDQLSFDVDVDWDATGQTSLALGAGRDFRTSADERNVDSTLVYLSATHRLTDPVRLDARTSYQHERFGSAAGRPGRTDHRYGIEGGARYSLTERASAALAYRFQRRESDEARFTYNRHIVDASVLFRF